MSERILAAVDPTGASRLAVRYAGELLANSSSTFVLFHLLECPPCTASDLRPVPGIFERVPPEFGHDLNAYRKHLSEKSRAQPVLERLADELVACGVDRARVETAWSCASSNAPLGSEIVDAAERHGCRTILVGRHALPWYREALHAHVGDWLTRHAAGFTVWIVEGAKRLAPAPVATG